MSDAQPTSRPVGVYRHRLSTRLWHWINALTLLVMLMSGLMIFNAHPRLYWGQYGANPDTPWLRIGSSEDHGYLQIGDTVFDTTGYLGHSTRADSSRVYRRAFPSWATIPSYYSLGLSRRWHLTFAWLLTGSLLLYLVWSVLNGHAFRDLLPQWRELKPMHVVRHIGRHMLLRLPRGEAARHYNILQKLAYLGVVGVLLPLVILTGLTMSPSIAASWSWLLDLFGGRQTARSIHFISAFLLVLFFLVHVTMVLVAGPFNGIRSMITGRYVLPREKP